MYFIHLDSIRWYAVIMVVFAHIFQIWTWDSATVSLFPLGQAGVVIFFVLSGFLITRLLLKESVNKPIKQCFKEFYIRRSLRIFPIYYLFLIMMYSINIAGVQSYGIAPWLYTTNLYIFNQNSWIGPYSHLWTLAVEEQFYFIWPFLVLFLKERTRALIALFISVIIMSLSARFFLFINDFSSTQINVHSLTSIHCFAIGALVALGNINYNKQLKYAGYPMLVTGILLYYGSYYIFNAAAFAVINQLAIGLAAAGLIIRALYSDIKQNILHNKLTIHLGKISYGIYLYHNIIVANYADIAKYLGIETGTSIYIKIALSLLFTLSIAELSYRLIEEPVLRFKNKLTRPVIHSMPIANIPSALEDKVLEEKILEKALI